MNSCGQGTLESPIFETADWGAAGEKLKLDVYIPNPQQNPNWGGLKFFITVQPANLVYR